MPSQFLKKFPDSYLYQHTDYTKEIFSYLMGAKIIEKSSEAFSDITYNIKTRAVSPVLLKVLMSDKVKLCIASKPMPRPFKVIWAKDPRDKKAEFVWVDCTDVIVDTGTSYKCNDSNIKKLCSYLITAMAYIIYNAIPDKLFMNTTIVQTSTEAFVDMMIYVLGFLKVPITYSDNKEQMAYVLANYFQRNVMCKTNMDSIHTISKKISKCDPKKCVYLDTIYDELYSGRAYLDINDFLVQFAQTFLNQDQYSKDPDRLNIDVLVQKWMYVFGPDTFLGLELFVPFSAILTNCYVGAYINQQNTIEKVVGSNVIEFTNELINIGSDNG